jgi:lipoyl(octanoyl) transferase
LEQTVIDTLKRFNITSERSDLNAGVWIRNSKISAQGINASRWITIHGASLNVSTDLSYYQKIVPCGLDRSIASVCSMNSLLHPSTFMITNVAEEWTKSFSTVFNVSIENVSNSMDIISSIPNKDKLERIIL